MPVDIPVTVVGIVLALRPAIEGDVVLADQMHGRHVARQRRTREQPVQLVDQLPALLAQRLRDRADLEGARADAREGRSAAITRRQHAHARGRPALVSSVAA